jgi:hypothetical protein
MWGAYAVASGLLAEVKRRVLEVCATLGVEKRLAEGGEGASVGRLVVSARSAKHGPERQAQDAGYWQDRMACLVW